jgi:heptosyltransferase I
LIAPSEGGEKVDRLLIVRLSAMGDVIHTLPAVQALRQAFPNATIGWLIEERWAELLCAPGAPRRGPRSAQRPLADWVHTVNLPAWRKSLFTISTLQQIAKVWNDVRSARYDVVVDLQGAIRSAVLASWSGARVVYGAAEPREAPASLWYTRRAIARGAHVIEQNLSIAAAVAQRKMQVPRVEFPHDAEAEQRIEQRLAEAGGGEFAILNPGAGWGAKRWPAERYGRVARALAERGVRSIVNIGPGEDELARAAEAASAGAAMPMKCSITELIALTRQARLFIGGDTGPMHLAAALQVPVVAIFGPTDPTRNGPYPMGSGTRNVVLRNAASPTTHARRAQPDEGLLEIGVGAVVDAAQKLLAHGHGGGQENPPHSENPAHTENARNTENVPNLEGAHG